MPSATATSEYELVLMLDPETPEDQREKLAGDVRGRIEAAGELRHGETWGTRKLAYEVRKRTEADYRFFRFQGESSLLDALDHSLKIAEGVLRFRIFGVDPRAPIVAPPSPVQAARGRREGRDGKPRRSGAEGRGHGDDGEGQPDAELDRAPEGESAQGPTEPSGAEDRSGGAAAEALPESEEEQSGGAGPPDEGAAPAAAPDASQPASDDAADREASS